MLVGRELTCTTPPSFLQLRVIKCSPSGLGSPTEMGVVREATGEAMDNVLIRSKMTVPCMHDHIAALLGKVNYVIKSRGINMPSPSTYPSGPPSLPPSHLPQRPSLPQLPSLPPPHLPQLPSRVCSLRQSWGPSWPSSGVTRRNSSESSPPLSQGYVSSLGREGRASMTVSTLCV